MLIHLRKTAPNLGAVFLLYLRNSCVIFFMIILAACEGPYGSRSMAELQALSLNAHMPCTTFEGNGYTIYGCMTDHAQDAKTLTVVIEGDGLAWRTHDEISQDPTPRVPVGMQIAKDLKSPGVKLYLARPGQYIQSPNQIPKDWTRGRFSKKILEAYGDIINQMHAQEVHLMGYSGGASLAILLVPYIKAIKQVTTFAGVLDHKAWTTFHDYSPLSDSLNPPDYLKLPVFQRVRFTHYYGLEDETVPPQLVDDFKKQWVVVPQVRFIPIKDFEHTSPWGDLLK